MKRVKIVVPIEDNKDPDFPFTTSCMECSAEVNLPKDFEDGSTFMCISCRTKFEAVKPTPLTILAMRFKNAEND